MLLVQFALFFKIYMDISNKPRILYISSASPVNGPGCIGGQHFSKLKEAGFDIDMLTLYKEPMMPDVLYLRGLFFRYTDSLKRRFFGKKAMGLPYCFFYKKDSEPPVPINILLNKITKEYDLVIVYFWQEMLSFATIKAIYEKLNHPVIFFLSPDFSHMSGGCHFTCNCKNYQTGCGCCPAFGSQDMNDFTRWNVNYRAEFYEKVKPIIFGNSYMNSFYQKSFLLKKARVIVSPPSFNVVTFKPIEVSIARSKMGITSSESFVIAFGCQSLSDPRKGVAYLIEALSIMHERLSEQENSKIILLIAGADYNEIKDKLPFKSISTGFIDRESLSYFYSAANIFVCPSVDDAGPLMVSQSIACGTPVVGFKMGAMLDAVMDRGTGYCANLKDSEDLANGIEKFYRMDRLEYASVSEHCRRFANDHSGFDATIKRWLDLYEKYRTR